MIKMPIRLLVFATFCGTIAMPVVLSSPRVLAVPAQSRAERELRAIYKKTEQAYLRRDFNFLIALETPDFKHKNQKGFVKSRAQADADWRKGFKMFSAIHAVKYTILGVKTSGKKAMVSYRRNLKATLGHQGRRVARLQTVTQGYATWLRTPRGWRLQFSDTPSVKHTIDGKPVNS